MAGLQTRLRMLRAATGETQTQLGEAVGAGQATVWGWERGRVKPDWEMLCTLADHFGVSVDYLVGRTEDPQPPVAGDQPAATGRLGRWLREALIDRRASLADVAAAGHIPLAVLLAIQEGTASTVAPVHLRQIAAFFGRPEAELAAMLPTSPQLSSANDDKVEGIAADAASDLTADERRQVEEVIRRIRRERRVAPDGAGGGG